MRLRTCHEPHGRARGVGLRVPDDREKQTDAQTKLVYPLEILHENSDNLYTRSQSNLLHVYFNITTKHRSVLGISLN
jgi:hypothetical protein